MTDAYWRSVAEKEFGKNPDGTTNNAALMLAPHDRLIMIETTAKGLKEQAKRYNVTTNEELKKKIAEWWAEQGRAKREATERETSARMARREAEIQKRKYGHVQTGDLLGMDEKPEKELLKFQSRDEELKGLFGGRGKKHRKTRKGDKKSRKAKKSRKH